MGKRLLVFQHIEWEGPGRFLVDAAQKLEIDLTIIRLWKQKIPSLSRFDGLVVLGGRPEMDQVVRRPYLTEEKIAIKQSIKEDRPYLGICLGHLLLAEAIGASVGDNYCASLGFVDGFLTKKGKCHPFFKKMPVQFPLFKWHSQAILTPVPRNIAILATSAECQVEAFSLKGRPHIIGVQFDNNAAETADVKRYLNKDRKWLSSFKDKYINTSAIISDAIKFQEILAKHYTTIFTNFIALT